MEPSVYPKINIDNLSKFLLKAGNENRLFLQNHISFIVGGCVYKKIAGDNTNDVDIVTNDVKNLGKKLINTYNGAYHPLLPYSGIDVTKVLIKNAKLEVDIISIDDMADSINKCGLNMTNALVMCSDSSIKHILEVPVLQTKLNWEAKDAKKEREWALLKIREKKYCNTKGLREKDSLYFKTHGWSVIDEFECKCHGMFN